MSAREIAHRLGRQFSLFSLRAQHHLSARFSRDTARREEYAFCQSDHRQLPDLPVDTAEVSAAAQRLLAGGKTVAGREWQWTDKSDIWHQAPDTGRTWPRKFFATIPYREGNAIGDVRQVWEPSRLQHLLDAALAADLEGPGDRKLAAELLTKQLESWVRENPPLVGPHYISVMECGLRLIAVCHACDLLRADFHDELPWRALSAIVESHAPLIERSISVHSSAGNHTVAEAAGLVFAGLLFPEMRYSHRRATRGLELLSDAASTQVLPDGGGIEQAIWYHKFNIELFWLVQTLLEHQGLDVPDPIKDAVERGSRFLCTMGLDAGWLPSIGDSDGGYAVSQFFRLPVRGEKVDSAVPTFALSGYTVAMIGTAAGDRLIFDHGPLGMPPSYGHGHADALSLLMRTGAHDLFVDPGTYTYTGDQAWRRYFRSTTAHNTVTVGGEDQARQEACFMWSKPYSTHVLAAETDGRAGRLLAEHDGYRGIGVRHMRGIAWEPGQWLLVWDRLEGSPDRTLLDLHWHLPRPPVVGDANRVHLTLEGRKFTIWIEGGVISTHVGELNPILGWRSVRYGQREPIATLKIRHEGALPHTFTTVLWWPRQETASGNVQEALEWMTSRTR